MNLWNEKWFGYWRTDEESSDDEDSTEDDLLGEVSFAEYPDIKDYINQGRETDTRLLEYLKNGIALAITTKSNCLVDEDCRSYFNGGLSLAIRTDGCFVWRSDLIHYVVYHGVCLPEFWISEILSREYKFPERYGEILHLLEKDQFSIFDLFKEVGLLKIKSA